MLQTVYPEKVVIIKDPAGNGYIVEARYMNDSVGSSMCTATDLDDACDCVVGAFKDGTIGSGPKRREALLKNVQCTEGGGSAATIYIPGHGIQSGPAG